MRVLIERGIRYSPSTSHPEVTDVGLVTLLFAGTTSLFSFKYSRAVDAIVKKLKRRGQSAGNLSTEGSSETIRGEIVEKVHAISEHIPTHQRPDSEAQFGHYLAGLIDGGGHFSRRRQLVVAFHSRDIALAYYVKNRLGFGNVRLIKGKNAAVLVLSSCAALERIFLLIGGKLRTKRCYDQAVNNIFTQDTFATFTSGKSFELNTSLDLENH